jgi:hypothetical protein
MSKELEQLLTQIYLPPMAMLMQQQMLARPMA